MTTTKFDVIRNQEMAAAAKVFAAVLKTTPVQGDGTTTWPMRVMHAYATACAEQGIRVSLKALYKHYRGRELSSAAKHFFKVAFTKPPTKEMVPDMQPQQVAAEESKGAKQPPVSLVQPKRKERDGVIMTYDPEQFPDAKYKPLYEFTSIETIKAPKGVSWDEKARAAFVEYVQQVLNEPDVTCAYPCADHVVIARHPDGWGKVLKDEGVVVDNSGKKVGKRLKAVLRLYPVRGEIPQVQAELKLVVDHKPGEDERLYSGLILMKPWIKTVLLKQSGQAGNRKYRECPLWNVRVMMRLHGKPVQIKGNVLFTEQTPQGADIWTHNDNVKGEVGGSRQGMIVIGMEPQGPKDEARTSLQSALTLPPMFENTEDWAQAILEQWEKEVCEEGACNEDIDRMAETLDRQWRGLVEQGEFTSKLYLRRWQAKVFYTKMKALGVEDPFACSPFIRHEYFAAVAQSLRNVEKGEVNVPVPKTSMVQVVCATIARLAGFDVGEGMQDNEIRRKKGWPFAVVSDKKWLEASYINHGGPDFDDKFCLHYRVLGGKKVVVVMRFPCDRGEWDVLGFHEGDYEPAGAWETIKIDRKQWKRLTDLKGEVKIGKPSKSQGVRRKEYDKEQVIEDLRRALAGGNPGGVINKKMVWASAHPNGGAIPNQPMSNEDVIDTFTQGGNMQDVTRVKEWADRLLGELVEERAAVDELVWMTRGNPKGKVKPLIVRGRETQKFDAVCQLVNGACQRVKQYAWEHRDMGFLQGLNTQESNQAVKNVVQYLRVNRGKVDWNEFDRKLAASLRKYGLAFASSLIAAGKEEYLWNRATFVEYITQLELHLPTVVVSQ